jgi:hypothetical protein
MKPILTLLTIGLGALALLSVRAQPDTNTAIYFKAPALNPALKLYQKNVLVIGDAVVVRVSDAEWAALLRAFPTNVRTTDLNFYAQ